MGTSTTWASPSAHARSSVPRFTRTSGRCRSRATRFGTTTSEAASLTCSGNPGFDRVFLAMTMMGALFVKGVETVRTFTDGEELDVPGRPRVVFTPGHTHGHCALHLRERGGRDRRRRFRHVQPVHQLDGASDRLRGGDGG